MAVILCVIESLAVGGAEMTTTRLADAWACQGHDVHIALVRPDTTLVPQSAAWHVHRLSAGGAYLPALAAVRKLARTLRPDFIVGHMPKGALLALAARGGRAKVVLAEHSVPARHYHGLKRHLVRTLMGGLYRAADTVVAVSHGAAASLAAWGVPFAKIRVVGNPIPLEQLQAQATQGPSGWTGDVPRIVALGRLAPEKGFDVLLDALALLKQRGLTVAAQIIGEGPCRAALEAQRASLGLQDTVQMPGYSPNPYPALAESDVLVCSSRYEGFGNVLVEALALGVRCVALDCPCGPRDILVNEAYGRLVPAQTAEGLADALMAELRTRPPYSKEQVRAGAAQFEAHQVARAYLGGTPIDTYSN